MRPNVSWQSASPETSTVAPPFGENTTAGNLEAKDSPTGHVVIGPGGGHCCAPGEEDCRALPPTNRLKNPMSSAPTFRAGPRTTTYASGLGRVGRSRAASSKLQRCVGPRRGQDGPVGRSNSRTWRVECGDTPGAGWEKGRPSAASRWAEPQVRMGQILELSDQGDLPGVVSEQPAGVLGRRVPRATGNVRRHESVHAVIGSASANSRTLSAVAGGYCMHWKYSRPGSIVVLFRPWSPAATQLASSSGSSPRSL